MKKLLAILLACAMLLSCAAMAETTLLSRPPESRTPYGTSDISWRFTAARSACRMSSLLAGTGRKAPYSNQSRRYQRFRPGSRLQ